MTLCTPSVSEKSSHTQQNALPLKSNLPIRMHFSLSTHVSCSLPPSLQVFLNFPLPLPSNLLSLSHQSCPRHRSAAENLSEPPSPQHRGLERGDTWKGSKNKKTEKEDTRYCLMKCACNLCGCCAQCGPGQHMHCRLLDPPRLERTAEEREHCSCHPPSRPRRV